MATFKKTLTMSQVSNMPDRQFSSEEISLINNFKEGRAGNLHRAVWNGTPCWNDIDLAKSFINKESVYLSSLIKMDDINTNTLTHTATNFIHASPLKSKSIDDVVANSISFTPKCYITYHHDGDDLWTVKCTVDLRYGSQTVFDTLVEMYGSEEQIFSFNGEVLMHDILNFGQVYTATKTLTWDRISHLTWTIENKTIGEDSTDEIITFTIS